jgi:hypothetical protein
MDYLDVWNDDRFRKQRIEGNPFTQEDENQLGLLGV